MTYAGRKKQLSTRHDENALLEMIIAHEGENRNRRSYLKKLEKKHLVQIMLAIEFGNTHGFEPIEIEKKTKKTKKEQDGGKSIEY